MADPVIPEQLLLSSDHKDGVVVVLVPMSHHQLLMKLPPSSISLSTCPVWMYVVSAMGLPQNCNNYRPGYRQATDLSALQARGRNLRVLGAPQCTRMPMAMFAATAMGEGGKHAS